MKKIFVLIACLCLLMVGAKPHHSLVVTYENVNYGYEGDPYDGILGSDEMLQWIAEGQLAPGEQSVYTYLPSSGSRWVFVRAYPRTGKGSLTIEIEAVVHTAIGDLAVSASGEGEACLEVPGYRPYTADWEVRITNNGDKTVRRIYVDGRNETNFGQGCD